MHRPVHRAETEQQEEQRVVVPPPEKMRDANWTGSTYSKNSAKTQFRPGPTRASITKQRLSRDGHGLDVAEAHEVRHHGYGLLVRHGKRDVERPVAVQGKM